MKKIAVLLLALIIAGSFSACTGSDDSAVTEATTAQTETTEKATETTVATTEETTQTTTEETTQATTTETTTKATTASTKADVFTEDDAIDMVKKKFSGDKYGYFTEGLKDVEGEDYYCIRLAHRVDGHYSTLTYYFIKKDGSEMLEGWPSPDGSVEIFD